MMKVHEAGNILAEESPQNTQMLKVYYDCFLLEKR